MINPYKINPSPILDINYFKIYALLFIKIMKNVLCISKTKYP